MRCTFPLVFTILTLATPLGGQVTPGHVYWVGFYQALPGKVTAYNKALTDIGDRDLAFRGWLLRHAEERGGSPTLTRGMDIDIYLTIRLRLVAHLCRWSLREGEGLREEHRVAAHDSAAQLIEWLKQENAGRL